MQDIVFYAAAHETLGLVRDHSNMQRSEAPTLTIGVSVCLRMRLFADIEVSTPYPVDSLDGITDWQWCMDSDFDRNTVCKLAADAGGISVRTVTDTVNGETMDFTEFVIPISNMNTQELAAWLGNDRAKSGLNGELVGYDNEGHAVFVLQIENFKVLNRVFGLGDPTAVDQEIVTHPVAERMIRTAVSASAATKQDILTAGYRMELVSGSTVDQARYFAIDPVITAPANKTTTVVLSAGKAYEIHAVATNAKVLLNREDPPFARTFGLEGHAEIFVANTGYIQTGGNVVLSQPLEPDSVNNCTVRFHDNLAIISVEDHVAGYIVTDISGTTEGTLPYGLSAVSSDYIAFDARTNGRTINLADAVTNGEKHIVGNGYAETAISGGITCTNKTTVSNLSMLNVVVNGGTMTLGDAFIPSGSTVLIDGGGLEVERVNGDGGMINLGGTNIIVSSGATASASGCTFSGGAGITQGGTALYGGAVFNHGNATFIDCVFSGNSAQYGGVFYASRGSATISGCTVSGNTESYGAILVQAAAKVTLIDSEISDRTRLLGTGTIELRGSNSINTIKALTQTTAGTVIISNGAVVDLTGNTDEIPIAPGGGVVIGSDARIYPSAGSASAVEISGGTYTAITNGGVLLAPVSLSNGGAISGNAIINMNGENRMPFSSTTFEGVTITGYSNNNNLYGGPFFANGTAANMTLNNCIISGNRGGAYCGVFAGKGRIKMNACVVSGNTTTNTSTGGAVACGSSGCLITSDCSFYDKIITFTTAGSGSMSLAGNTIINNVMYGTGNLVIESGAIVDLTGNTNSAVITQTGSGGITLYGGALASPTMIIGSAGSSTQGRVFCDLEIHGTTISNIGAIYGATVYSNIGEDHEIWYTPDSGATTSTVIVSGETAYVVNGGLIKVTNT